MVIETRPLRPPKLNLLRRSGSRLTGKTALDAGGLRSDSVVVKANLEYRNTDKPSERQYAEDDADDVIDLGAPKLPRRPLPGQSPSRARKVRSYTPNPRLYPGPPKSEPKKVKRAEGRGRRHKRVFRRPVPNSRLYRPVPPRPTPPPPSPWRGSWPPPAPTQRSLATASIVALQLSETPPEHKVRPQNSRRLVVTLPAQQNTMDPMNRTPEEGSDGNETSSAPSEFLAEFLSAIMQRQYAEALKYCRLILQYEPHNATALGFYSLLQHKVSAPPAAAPPSPPTPSSPARRSPGYPVNLNDPPGPRLGSSSADSSPRRPHASPAPRRLRKRAVDAPVCSSHEGMEQEEDETSSSSDAGAAGAGARDVSRSGSVSGSESDDSCASQSSLELDSSPSLSLSRRTDHTDSASGSGAGWESSGTPLSSRSTGGASGQPTDDNGNAPPTPEPKASLHADDMQNDNDRTSPLKSTSSSETLRRLRAHFACSIK